MTIQTPEWNLWPKCFCKDSKKSSHPKWTNPRGLQSLRTDISEMSDLSYPACLLTSKVRAICQLHFFTGLGDDTSNAMLDEIHFLPHGAFSNDVVSRLEHLKSQLAQHGRHKIGIRVSEKRHRGHQFPAVEVDYFLKVAGVSTQEEETESYLGEKYMLTLKTCIYTIMVNLRL